MDGAPNGIIVPRWSLSSTHLKGSRPWANYPEFVGCHAGRARSGEEGVSGSRSPGEGRDRCGAQAHAQPAQPFFAELPPCVVAMEACSSAHHWGRALIALGLARPPLLPPAHVKPYVRRNKNDAVDAAAIYGAMRSAWPSGSCRCVRSTTRPS